MFIVLLLELIYTSMLYIFCVGANGLTQLSGVPSKETELFPAFHDVQLVCKLGLLHTLCQLRGHPLGDLTLRSIFAWPERLDGSGRNPGSVEVRLAMVEKSDVVPLRICVRRFVWPEKRFCVWAVINKAWPPWVTSHTSPDDRSCREFAQDHLFNLFALLLRSVACRVQGIRVFFAGPELWDFGRVFDF